MTDKKIAISQQNIFFYSEILLIIFKNFIFTFKKVYDNFLCFFKFFIHYLQQETSWAQLWELLW
jgi:hypothetical protein